MLHDPDRPWNSSISYGGSIEDRLTASAVYYAALLGLDAILEHILTMPHTAINARGGLYSTALLAASANGHDKIVQMLLDNNANVHAKGGCYGNVLQTASALGHKNIVQVLLDKGCDVNARGTEYGTALEAASHSGHEDIRANSSGQGSSCRCRSRTLWKCNVDGIGSGSRENCAATTSARSETLILSILVIRYAQIIVKRYIGEALRYVEAETKGHCLLIPIIVCTS